MSSATSSQPAALRSVGALFRDTARIYRAHFFTLVGFAGWIAVPLVVTVLLRVTFGDTSTVADAILVTSGISVAIATWCYCHLVQFTTHVATHHTPYETLPVVTPSLLPVFFTFLLYGIAVGVGMVFILPGLVFTVWFAFAPVIAASERGGIFAGLGKSRELVRGRFFRIAGRLWSMDLVFALTYVAIIVGIDLALGYDVAHIDPTSPLPVTMDIVLCLFEILALPFVVVYRTLLYLAVKNR